MFGGTSGAARIGVDCGHGIDTTCRGEVDVPTAAQPRLNPTATVEALLFIAQRLESESRQPDLHNLGHLLYLADRMHLEEYGRTFSGERFHAMEHGPTPSLTYDALKVLADRDPHYPPAMEFLNALGDAFAHTGGPEYRSVRPPRLEHLSASARECLEAVLAMASGWDFSRLRHETHDEAYLLAKARRLNSAMPIEEIARTLRDGESLVEYLRDPVPG